MERNFLQALKAALENKQVHWSEPVDWEGLFEMASKHQVLPLIFEAVYACPAAKAADPQLMAAAKRKTMQNVMLQTQKTEDFLTLYAQLREKELRPLVVKGLICRSLYPNPDFRLSNDEDVLIPEAEFGPCRALLEELGMVCTAPNAGPDDYEIPYIKPRSPLFIELHQSLFSPGSDAYGDLNQYFTQSHRHAVKMNLRGAEILTMDPTDHLFYLICHSFKHFLHSGFGIRQVCDIVLFGNTYGREIDWELVLANCRAIRAEKFAAAMFRMGEAYLTFDPDRACWPRSWRDLEVDCLPMLEDLLDGGVFGDGSRNRKHSASLTLNAVIAQKQGKKAGSGMLQSLFPTAHTLAGRYPYLKEKPWLLPVAWGSRLLKYSKETRDESGSDAAGTIEIGNRRIELLREYGIISKE